MRCVPAVGERGGAPAHSHWIICNERNARQLMHDSLARPFTFSPRRALSLADTPAMKDRA